MISLKLKKSFSYGLALLLGCFFNLSIAGETTIESVSYNGVQGNANSDQPSISADGRFVAFNSASSNLVTQDNNNSYDSFIHDRLTKQTTRVSINSHGVEGNFGGLNTVISGDGRFVAFESFSTNLVDGDTNNNYDIFLHDRVKNYHTG